jgi:hypothetical protein
MILLGNAKKYRLCKDRGRCEAAHRTTGFIEYRTVEIGLQQTNIFIHTLYQKFFSSFTRFIGFAFPVYFIGKSLLVGQTEIIIVKFFC